ncbi:MAG: trigger factor [Rhodospirillales bacterium]|nr:trigger factor [Rhodospirillales bacterium]
MQVTEVKQEGLTREFKVTVPWANIADRVSARLQELTHTVRMPGFRPGKVPVALMRKKYGPAIMGEVLERAVNESSQAALSERGLRPAGVPKVEITSFKDDTDLEYAMTVDIMPEIKPINFSALALERLTSDPDPADVEKTLERLSKAHGSTEAITEARAAQIDDVVQINFVGKRDGVEFPGGAGKGYMLELGSKSFIPGFEDKLVGARPGQKVTFDITFPEDYGAAELAGKAVTFEVDVREIHARVDAKLDDDLAKKVGAESLDGLKQAIRGEQEREIKALARVRLKRSLLDQLADGHSFQVPGAMVETEFNTIWKHFDEHRQSGQMAADDEYKGKADDEIKGEFRTLAERRVRLGLLLAEVGRVNNITVTQDEINQAISGEARRFPGKEKDVFEYYKKTPEAMNALRAPIYEEKVVDFIVEMAKVTERKVPLADLLKDPETEAKAEASEGKDEATESKDSTTKKKKKKKAD